MAGMWTYVESEDAAVVVDELTFFCFPQTVLVLRTIYLICAAVAHL